MGNSSSNFVNLDETLTEKSLFSFKVKLVKISVEQKKLKLTKSMPNYKFKLKLYPSTLTLKNDNCKIDFSYFNIKSWVTDKQFFSFETVDGETYMFLTEDKINSVDISDALKEHCNNIKKRNN